MTVCTRAVERTGDDEESADSYSTASREYDALCKSLFAKQTLLQKFRDAFDTRRNSCTNHDRLQTYFKGHKLYTHFGFML